MIVGQYFGNAHASQSDHRPAVGQAVLLVRPGLGECSKPRQSRRRSGAKLASMDLPGCHGPRHPRLARPAGPVPANQVSNWTRLLRSLQTGHWVCSGFPSENSSVPGIVRTGQCHPPEAVRVVNRSHARFTPAASGCRRCSGRAATLRPRGADPEFPAARHGRGAAICSASDCRADATVMVTFSCSWNGSG